MKEITIKLKGRDSWISVILGIYGALGAFISLSREATIDNSPDIDLESQIMLYTRTMYRSFSSNRLRTFLFALVIGILVYMSCNSAELIKNVWQISYSVFCLRQGSWLP